MSEWERDKGQNGTELRREERRERKREKREFNLV